MLTKHALATSWTSAECAEFAMFTLELATPDIQCEKDVEMELWQSHNRTVGNEAPKYCNWTCNWYFTTCCKQLHAFCSALQITSVVVKWNYNYKLLCLKTCNHYIIITSGFSITTTLLYSAFYHIFIACILLEIGHDKHAPVDCGSTTRYATFNFCFIKVLVSIKMCTISFQWV